MLILAVLAWALLPAASQAATSPVADWNGFLLGLQATPGDQPATVHPTYELAVVHAAIYDAVVAIDRSAAPYLPRIPAPRTASRGAAADAAAHDALTALYPRAARRHRPGVRGGDRARAGRPRPRPGRAHRTARRRADPARPGGGR